MRPRGTRLFGAMTVLAFVGAITFPLLGWLFHGIPPPGRLQEERFAYARPGLPRDLAGLSSFPRAFENWFGDALGGRSTLLGWRSREMVGLFGLSPTPVAYMGRDAWLFLAPGREFEMQRGGVPFGRFELEAWTDAIRARQTFCREHGAEYIFVIAPDKTYVYPERHALALEPFGPSRTDQLKAAFAGDPVFLDLRPSLLEAKARDAPGDHAYFPYGSHWTDRGAAAGMRTLGDHLRVRPGLERWPTLDEAGIHYASEGVPGDTWADRLYLSGFLEQSERAIASIDGPRAVFDFATQGHDGYKGVSTSDDPTLPRVLLFHDSFGQAASPLIARASSRCVALWDFFHPELVVEEKPDVVVELFVERVLGRPPVENLELQGDFGRRLFEAGRRTFVMDMARDAHSVGALGGIETRVEDGVIAIRWMRPTAIAALPAEVLPDSAHAVVRLEVEVPEAVDVNFHYKTTESTEYSRIHAITKVLPPGRSEVFLHFAVPNIRGPVAFRLNRSVELKLIACESRLLDS